MEIPFVDLLGDLDHAIPGEDHLIASYPRGQNTVEHVDATADDLQNPDRIAQPHEVPWAIVRGMKQAMVQHVHGQLAFFAYAETSYCKSLRFQLHDTLSRLLPEVAIEATLRDTEQQLVRLTHRLLRPPEPGDSPRKVFLCCDAL